MSLLDGGIRDTFAAAFGGVYEDAFLVVTTRTEDEGGDITEGEDYLPIKAHAPGRSEAYRAQAGFADGEIEVLVLKGGLDTNPTTDHRLTYGPKTYSITRVSEDGAHSHWRIRAKVWNG